MIAFKGYNIITGVRTYQFSTKDEERKFRLFWSMGFIADLQPNK
jgi:hypothetical protein